MGKLRFIALMTGTALLAGCTAGSLEMDDTYTGSAHYERYPIRVAKAPMKLEVASSRGGLRASQVNSIVSFARSAEMASASQVSLRRPSGGGASAATARQVYNLLVQNGLSPRNIHQGTYRGSGNAPVLIAFTRTVAVTKECGDWSSDLANTPDNQPHSNFGCAVQQNTAAMVQNPADFEVPTPTDPVNAPYRVDLKKLFVKLD
jgi:pilus assembly protein CpaD